MSTPPPGPHPDPSWPQGPPPQGGFQQGPFQQGPFPPQGPPPGYPPQGPGAPPPGWQGPPQGWAQGPAPAAVPAPQSLRMIVQVLCPVLVLAGLSIPQGGSVGWADYTLWAIFAAAMSLGQLVTLSQTRNPQTATLALIATGALVAYWVVIVLPGISSNGGFLQTLGVGCAVVGAWLAGGRR